MDTGRWCFRRVIEQRRTDRRVAENQSADTCAANRFEARPPLSGAGGAEKRPKRVRVFPAVPVNRRAPTRQSAATTSSTVTLRDIKSFQYILHLSVTFIAL